MSDLVGNPEDRFSRDAAQIVCDSIWHFGSCRVNGQNFGF